MSMSMNMSMSMTRLQTVAAVEADELSKSTAC